MFTEDFAGRICGCELGSASQTKTSVRSPFKSEGCEGKAMSWDHFRHGRADGLATIRGSSGGMEAPDVQPSWFVPCSVASTACSDVCMRTVPERAPAHDDLCPEK